VIWSSVVREVTGTASRMSASASARGQAGRPRPVQAREIGLGRIEAIRDAAALLEAASLAES